VEGPRRGDVVFRAAALRDFWSERGFFPAARFAAGRAVFRPALEARLDPAPLRVDARVPLPARLFDGVRFCPFVDFRAVRAVLRRAAFLAMVV